MKWAGVHIATALLLTAQLSYAAEFSGRVVSVADGDTATILLLPQKIELTVRLAGIDAPEKHMPFGSVSKRSLSDLAFGKEVVVEYDHKDQYGRFVGKLTAAGEDLNLIQIKRGLAWHYKQYAGEQSVSDRSMYAAAESKARDDRQGLWRDENPEPPWEWRKRKRSKKAKSVDTPQ